jgi:hypothetical protein
MSGWKKWFFVGLGFGIGAALVCGFILGGLVWYSSGAKRWNTRAIQAHFSTSVYRMDDNWHVAETDLEYIVDNNTSKDFTLSPGQTFLLIGKDALRASRDYKLSQPCFVPAKTKVECVISAPAYFDTTVDIDGFALFDRKTRYKLIFPKPDQPTPDERKKTGLFKH